MIFLIQKQGPYLLMNMKSHLCAGYVSEILATPKQPLRILVVLLLHMMKLEKQKQRDCVWKRCAKLARMKMKKNRAAIVKKMMKVMTRMTKLMKNRIVMNRRLVLLKVKVVLLYRSHEFQ